MSSVGDVDIEAFAEILEMRRGLDQGGNGEGVWGLLLLGAGLLFGVWLWSSGFDVSNGDGQEFGSYGSPGGGEWAG